MAKRIFLLLPHLAIQNANALSSPYTIGFPAMSAWLGAMHALQRHLQPRWSVQLSKLAISCHEFNLQTYKGQRDFVYSIIGKAHPLKKDGERPSIIEEPRCHLNVSLLIELTFDSEQAISTGEKVSEFIHAVTQILNQMKFAGGDLLPFTHKVRLIYLDTEAERKTNIGIISRALMPGYVLIERRNLITEALNKNPDKDVLEILLDYLAIHHHPIVLEQPTTSDEKIDWMANRLSSGWLVPIAVGFQGISPVRHAQNQRDPATPHRFAESILTLGEFIMPLPSRFNRINDIFWHYHTDLANDLYLCQNQES